LSQDKNTDEGLIARIQEIEVHLMGKSGTHSSPSMAVFLDSTYLDPHQQRQKQLLDRIKKIEDWIVNVEEVEPRLAIQYFQAHKVCNRMNNMNNI
jgi:hypothetical protein